MFFRYPVSAETQAWVMDQFRWAAAQGLLRADTPLVTLDRRFFAAPSGGGPETARALLADFQRILRIPDSQIDILPLDRLPLAYRHDPAVADEVGGTWQAAGDGALIRYDPEHMIARPIAFMATLGHEVMHHVLRSLPELPPGGEATEELATDLIGICMGLGILQMAGAEQAGWQGYLRQTTRAHALAAFLIARGLPEEAALVHLPRRSGKLVKTAMRHLEKRPESCAALRALLS